MMQDLQLGTLTRIPVRTVWQQERDFSRWLAEHIQLLNQALGIEIELVEQEVGVGPFRCDLFGKAVGSGREVIIENQLEPTNHTHLGQLMTYGAGLDAKVVVWVSPEFREEHRQALDWLNFHTGENLVFFGVEIELLQIGNSLPAPNFTIVVQPNEWQPQPGTSEPSTRRAAYHDFFTKLLTDLKAASPGYTAANRVGFDSWMAFGAGRSGFSFNPAYASNGHFRVELYIDTGNYDRNKAAFDQLYDNRDQIAAQLGEQLTWQRLDQRRASRIFASRTGHVELPEQELEVLREWGVRTLVIFRSVLSPRLTPLALELPEAAEPGTELMEVTPTTADGKIQ